MVYAEASVHEGQCGVLTIASGEWFDRGRPQEASVFERNSLALKIDRATGVFGRIEELSVQCQYTIKTPVEGGGHQSKCWSSWVVDHTRTIKFLLLKTVESGNYGSWGRQPLPSLH